MYLGYRTHRDWSGLHCACTNIYIQRVSTESGPRVAYRYVPFANTASLTIKVRTTAVFPNRLWHVTQNRSPTRVVTPLSPNHARTTTFFNRNAHLFCLDTQLKANKWKTIIINFNATVVSNRRDGWACLCSVKCAVVKTLIEKKTASYPNQKAPLPSLGILPPCWEPVYNGRVCSVLEVIRKLSMCIPDCRYTAATREL